MMKIKLRKHFVTPDSFYESFYWGNIVARAKKSLINLTHTE